MHPSSRKMYDSIDHVVACRFYGMCFNTSEISTRIAYTRSNSQLITLCLQPSIVAFKPHPSCLSLNTLHAWAVNLLSANNSKCI